MTKDSDDKVFGQFINIGLPLNSILHEKYRLKEYMAIGHINLVYLGEQIDCNRKVLIKEFCPYAFANRDLDKKTVVCKGKSCKRQYEEAKKIFEKECDVHKKISIFPEKQRKNIAKYIECFEENKTKYLVLEYIPGIDLNNYIKKEKKLEFKKIARQIISAVMQIHKMGILHKDLKPANIIVGENKQIYIIDFGTADVMYEMSETVFTVLVSKGFSAPELYQRDNISIKTDIYSVGAIFYYMLVGQLVKNADERVFEDTVLPISNFIRIPYILEWAIMKCIQIEPKDRWSNMKILYLLLM